MAGRPLEHLLRRLRRIAAPSAGGIADADLLGRFADGRDEAAFEALVWRHGPLVYGLCRRVLGHTQDAEDAFQAAFLILARKAGTVRRRGAVGPWLYQVAQRVALRARGRVKVASPLPDDLAAGHVPDAAETNDLRRVIDEEIGRLPARYRAAVVLHYLEGRTTTEAAVALGCPTGTVLSRLAWARRRLRSRLTARGTALPAGYPLAGGLAAIGIGEVAGAVPARWVTAVVGTAGAFAAGGRCGRPALLAAEVLRTMLMAKLRVGAVIVFGVLATGAGLLLPGSSPGRPEIPEKTIPPVEVTVVRPTKRTAGEYLDFTGTTEAAAKVEVRSRVTAAIEKVAFRPGARVKRGDLLFELDARAFRVDYERAQAEAQRAESRLKRAQTDLDRIQRMIQNGTVSHEELSQAKGAVDEAQAGVLVAKSGLERARLDLDATRITAPIDGRTNQPLDAGNLANPNLILVTIVATDPIGVGFHIDAPSYLRMQKLQQKAQTPMHMRLMQSVEDVSYDGTIDFVDNRVEPARETVRARAIFPNADGTILPGMAAEVRLKIGEPREELSIPQAAIRLAGNRRYVLVLSPANTIEWRAVTLGPVLADGKQVVTAGVGAEDRIITEDIARLTPGAPIRARAADSSK